MDHNRGWNLWTQPFLNALATNNAYYYYCTAKAALWNQSIMARKSGAGRHSKKAPTSTPRSAAAPEPPRSQNREKREDDEHAGPFDKQSCPECHKPFDLTDLRPVQESCRHVKCRKCLITYQNGCFQCNQEAERERSKKRLRSNSTSRPGPSESSDTPIATTSYSSRHDTGAHRYSSAAGSSSTASSGRHLHSSYTHESSEAYQPTVDFNAVQELTAPHFSGDLDPLRSDFDSKDDIPLSRRVRFAQATGKHSSVAHSTSRALISSLKYSKNGKRTQESEISNEDTDNYRSSRSRRHDLVPGQHNHNSSPTELQPSGKRKSTEELNSIAPKIHRVGSSRHEYESARREKTVSFVDKPYNAGGSPERKTISPTTNKFFHQSSLERENKKNSAIANSKFPTIAKNSGKRVDKKNVIPVGTSFPVTIATHISHSQDKTARDIIEYHNRNRDREKHSTPSTSSASVSPDESEESTSPKLTSKTTSPVLTKSTFTKTYGKSSILKRPTSEKSFSAEYSSTIPHKETSKYSASDGHGSPKASSSAKPSSSHTQRSDEAAEAAGNNGVQLPTPSSSSSLGKKKKKRAPVVILNHITITNDGGRTLYRCDVCLKKFKTKAHIKYHEFCQNGEKPFKCEQCGQGFIAKSHYEYHLRTHTGERPYVCPECGKGFNQRGKVTRHMRSHTGEKPFVCQQCGRGFANAQAMRSHFLIHTGERPFACEFCNKRFTGMTNLKKHVITHTGERPFMCVHCGKSFGLKWTLDLHLRTHSSERPYACDQCSRAFSNSKDLRRHLVIHSGERPFKCWICGTAFRRKDNLDRHIKNTHNQPKEIAKKLANEAAAEYLASTKAAATSSSLSNPIIPPESGLGTFLRANSGSTSREPRESVSPSSSRTKFVPRARGSQSPRRGHHKKVKKISTRSVIITAEVSPTPSPCPPQPVEAQETYILPNDQVDIPPGSLTNSDEVEVTEPKIEVPEITVNCVEINGFTELRTVPFSEYHNLDSIRILEKTKSGIDSDHIEILKDKGRLDHDGFKKEEASPTSIRMLDLIIITDKQKQELDRHAKTSNANNFSTQFENHTDNSNSGQGEMPMQKVDKNLCGNDEMTETKLLEESLVNSNYDSSSSTSSISIAEQLEQEPKEEESSSCLEPIIFSRNVVDEENKVPPSSTVETICRAIIPYEKQEYPMPEAVPLHEIVEQNREQENRSISAPSSPSILRTSIDESEELDHNEHSPLPQDSFKDSDEQFDDISLFSIPKESLFGFHGPHEELTYNIGKNIRGTPELVEIALDSSKMSPCHPQPAENHESILPNGRDEVTEPKIEKPEITVNGVETNGFMEHDVNVNENYISVKMSDKTNSGIDDDDIKILKNKSGLEHDTTNKKETSPASVRMRDLIIVNEKPSQDERQANDPNVSNFSSLLENHTESSNSVKEDTADENVDKDMPLKDYVKEPNRQAESLANSGDDSNSSISSISMAEELEEEPKEEESAPCLEPIVCPMSTSVEEFPQCPANSAMETNCEPIIPDEKQKILETVELPEEEKSSSCLEPVLLRSRNVIAENSKISPSSTIGTTCSAIIPYEKKEYPMPEAVSSQTINSASKHEVAAQNREDQENRSISAASSPSILRASLDESEELDHNEHSPLPQDSFTNADEQFDDISLFSIPKESLFGFHGPHEELTYNIGKNIRGTPELVEIAMDSSKMSPCHPQQTENHESILPDDRDEVTEPNIEKPEITVNGVEINGFMEHDDNVNENHISVKMSEETKSGVDADDIKILEDKGRLDHDGFKKEEASPTSIRMLDLIIITDKQKQELDGHANNSNANNFSTQFENHTDSSNSDQGEMPMQKVDKNLCENDEVTETKLLEESLVNSNYDSNSSTSSISITEQLEQEPKEESSSCLEPITFSRNVVDVENKVPPSSTVETICSAIIHYEKQEYRMPEAVPLRDIVAQNREEQENRSISAPSSPSVLRASIDESEELGHNGHFPLSQDNFNDYVKEQNEQAESLANSGDDSNTSTSSISTAEQLRQGPKEEESSCCLEPMVFSRNVVDVENKVPQSSTVETFCSAIIPHEKQEYPMSEAVPVHEIVAQNPEVQESRSVSAPSSPPILRASIDESEKLDHNEHSPLPQDSFKDYVKEPNTQAEPLPNSGEDSNISTSNISMKAEFDEEPKEEESSQCLEPTPFPVTLAPEGDGPSSSCFESSCNVIAPYEDKPSEAMQEYFSHEYNNVHFTYADHNGETMQAPQAAFDEDVRILYASAAATADGDDDSGIPRKVRLLYAEALAYRSNESNQLQFIYTSATPNQEVSSDGSGHSVEIHTPAVVHVPSEGTLSANNVQRMLFSQPPPPIATHSLPLPVRVMRNDGIAVAQTIVNEPENLSLIRRMNEIQNFIPSYQRHYHFDVHQSSDSYNIESNNNPLTMTRFQGADHSSYQEHHQHQHQHQQRQQQQQYSYDHMQQQNWGEDMNAYQGHYDAENEALRTLARAATARMEESDEATTRAAAAIAAVGQQAREQRQRELEQNRYRNSNPSPVLTSTNNSTHHQGPRKHYLSQLSNSRE